MNCDAAIILLKINTCREHKDDVWENRLYYQVRHEKNWPLWGIWIFWGCAIVAFALSQKRIMYLLAIAAGLCILFLFILSLHKKRMVAHVLNFSKKDRDAGVGKNAPALNTEPAKAATSERHDDLMIKETTISLGSVLRGK